MRCSHLEEPVVGAGICQQTRGGCPTMHAAQGTGRNGGLLPKGSGQIWIVHPSVQPVGGLCLRGPSCWRRALGFSAEGPSGRPSASQWRFAPYVSSCSAKGTRRGRRRTFCLESGVLLGPDESRATKWGSSLEAPAQPPCHPSQESALPRWLSCSVLDVARFLEA